MVSKKKKVNDEKCNVTEDPKIKEFMTFFKIEIKSDEEIAEMSDKRQKQYECRVKRWNSLVNTHIEYEIYTSLTKFENFKHLIPLYKAKIEEIRSDPEVMPEFDRNKLKKLEGDHKNMTKEVELLRQQFEDIYIPFKKRQSEEAEEMLQIKREEMDSEFHTDIKSDNGSETEIKEEYISDEDSEEDVDIKEEYISEDDIKEEYISEEEIKEEYISEEDIKEEYVSDDTMGSNGEYFSAKEEDIDDKTSIKKEIKSEFDVKKEIKTEIKSEIKDEIKSEEEDDDSN